MHTTCTIDKYLQLLPDATLVSAEQNSYYLEVKRSALVLFVDATSSFH